MIFFRSGIRIDFKQLSDDQADQGDESLQKRKFNQDDLSELRSKLMLITIGADGKKHVDRFSKVLSLIELVSLNLKELIGSGCHLFANWKALIYCDQKRQVSVIIDFGYDAQIIQGGPHLEKELDQLAIFLKNALETWNQFMEKLRSDCPSLNFFTTDQLVILSRDLAKFVHNKSKNLNTQSIMMLNCIAPNLGNKDLLKFVRSHFSGASAQVNQQLDDDQMSLDDSFDNEEEDDFTEDIFAQFKESAVFGELKSNFSQNIVLASMVINLDILNDENQDINEILTDWCMEHEDDEGDIQKLLNDFKSNQSKLKKRLPVEEKKSQINTDEEQSDFVMVDAENEETEKLQTISDIFSCEQVSASLVKRLDTIWSNFLNFVNQLNIEDFVNFKVVAKILQDLSKDHEMKPRRSMLETLGQGRPNLIVCPEKEIHSTCLALYAICPDKPLPGPDEVLLCSANTSLEQIELICRRSFHDKSGKIYCILHAENIDYDSSVHIEKILSESTVTTHNYRLVFITGKEYNDRSYITTALDQYKRPMPEVMTAEKLQNYILNQLQTVHQSSDPKGCRSRLVVSNESGNGKSLVVSNQTKAMARNVITQVHTQYIQYESIIDRLFNETTKFQGNVEDSECCYHFDFASQSTKDKDDLIFAIAIIGGLTNPENGNLWLCRKQDYYLLEVTLPKNPQKLPNDHAQKTEREPILLINVLPKITCLSPKDSLQELVLSDDAAGLILETERPGCFKMGLDRNKFGTPQYQRPYRQLFKNDTGNLPNDNGDMSDCIKTILTHCCVQDPTWSEVANFTNFLNFQMKQCKNSYFCNLQEDLPGFRGFMTRFLIQMSKDFATRSVEISDESQGKGFCKPEIKDRQRWESTPHPYAFFNEDGHSVSFFGFFLRNLSIVDERNQARVLHENILNQFLYDALIRNGVKFNQSLDRKPRLEKIGDLCMVLGIELAHDVDTTYELTNDNVMKMMAIWMRWKCNIPVVIMGETGCGKTRLIRFMCDMLKQTLDRENMLILKMHGGIEDSDIFRIVNRAIRIAKDNTANGIKATVLFFDEANTTDSIATVKSVMCDRLVDGQPIPEDIGLQFVAAVNPYREHTQEMIEKLENAGLGYHIKQEETLDSIGSIPLRRLVYRVKEIPASLFPLIWDFGTLDENAEMKYIKQMVSKGLPQGHNTQENIQLVVQVLQQSQAYMRSRKDECSFVSLRDVERTLTVLNWFLIKDDILALVKQKMETDLFGEDGADFDLSLILALGVSFYARLEDRKAYVQIMTHALQLQPLEFVATIETCQKVFIDEMRLEKTIAKNDALMVINFLYYLL